ncbi:hypothetical protein C1J02_16060 [Sulfitobacter sp. SK011]|nr:hypothetical protein C1J02_16060 [Sulfitobacter sp. SK011]
MEEFKDRFGEMGCVAARSEMQSRVVSALAFAALAKDGSVPQCGLRCIAQQKTAFQTVCVKVGAPGPNQPFIARYVAALQLPQSGR